MMFDDTLMDLPEPQAGSAVMDAAERRALLRKPGNMLKALREIRRQAAEQVAWQTDITVARLGQVERGEAKPTASELQRLATHYGANPQALLDAFGYR